MAIFSRAGAASGFKFVDISDKPVEAEVIRNGVKVGRVDLREDLVLDYIAPDRLDDRLAQPRIVFQNVKAGDRVARGTVVDVVLSSRYLVGADFVAGSHASLAERSIGEVGDLFLADSAVENAIRGASSPDDLSPEIRGAIENTAGANDIPITSTASDRDFNALFTTIKAAQTFR
jgi:hypothetical protein